jgi:hypothetical protein
MTLDLGTELGKVKDVLMALASKVPHGTEEEAASIAETISSIGNQPAPEPEAETPGEETTDVAPEETEVTPETPVTPEAETPAEPVDLSHMSDTDLQAELAKRAAAGEVPTGSGS